MRQGHPPAILSLVVADILMQIEVMVPQSRWRREPQCVHPLLGAVIS